MCLYFLVCHNFVFPDVSRVCFSWCVTILFFPDVSRVFPSDQLQLAVIAEQAGPRLVREAVLGQLSGGAAGQESRDAPDQLPVGAADQSPLPETAVRLLVQLAVLAPPTTQLGSLVSELWRRNSKIGQFLIESLYLAGEEGVDLLLLPPASGPIIFFRALTGEKHSIIHSWAQLPLIR